MHVLLPTAPLGSHENGKNDHLLVIKDAKIFYVPFPC